MEHSRPILPIEVMYTNFYPSDDGTWGPIDDNEHMRRTLTWLDKPLRDLVDAVE